MGGPELSAAPYCWRFSKVCLPAEIGPLFFVVAFVVAEAGSCLERPPSKSLARPPSLALERAN